MHFFGKRLAVLICLVATPVLAHEVEDHAAIVIDTDMGLDDAVTLAMALQNPQLRITALVTCEGAASGEKSVEHLERMLALFNRQEIPLYAPARTGLSRKPPAFRALAEEAVDGALPASAKPLRRPFSPDAYVSAGERTMVLALGPLTNLAAALQEKPEIREGIQRVIVAGPPDPSKSWNITYDREALAAVQAVGVPLEFVVPTGRGACQPESWCHGEPSIGQGTSIGENFVKRLETPRARRHYTELFETFHDELVFLYCADNTLFCRQGKENVLVPSNQAGVVNLLTRLLSDGRQGKDRVVFVEGTLPDAIFQRDVRERKAEIIAKNGETEWFAQLLMSELHEHLGVYSVIGVKMGLRAAELLNAPQHAMKVVSRVPSRPPVSCLNDGIIVSTGSTPGRGLFAHAPGPPGTVEAVFAHNGRQVALVLKAEYRATIRAAFAALLKKHTLGDQEYWQGVRHLGLDIWENWHRRDLFEVATPPPALH